MLCYLCVPLCASVCVCVCHGTHLEVRGQSVGVNSFFPGSETNSSSWVGKPATSPTQPFHSVYVFISIINLHIILNYD